MKPIYLDYNATTPVDQEVLATMIPYLTEKYGNPSSSHSYGLETRMAVETAREQVANMMGCYPDEVFFTSGGTESNNIAIQGAALANRKRGNHLIISAVEHPAVNEVALYLKSFGFEISIIPVDSYGRVNPDIVESLILPTTTLISVMHANNEVGTVQPITEIAAIAHSHNIIFHTDAAQSVGKVPVKTNDLEVDLLSIAGHKLYAPKGVGALFVKRGISLQKIVHGADHEANMRPGTENVPYIVALGKACELVQKNQLQYAGSMLMTRNLIASGLSHEFPDLKINGHPDYCLPNTLNVSFKNTAARDILHYLPEVAVSAGAACHSSTGASGTLNAMNLPAEYSHGALRISTGRNTTLQDAEKAIEYINHAIKKAQSSRVYLTEKESSPQSFKETELFGAGYEYSLDKIPVDNVTSTNDTTEKSGYSNLRITQFDSALGCGCKMKPSDLDYILKKIAKPSDQNTLVSIDSKDDAAVWKLNEKEAIVQTIDFFTPMIDNPYNFGAIAAANAMSDIYAMGAKPVFALNLVTFPVDRLPLDVLNEIIRGASDKCSEAGIATLGGHSIEDTGIKFGLVVTGLANPTGIIRNSWAQTGDKLILTKAIGTGIITKAISKGLIAEDNASALECIQSMMMLNKTASEIMSKYNANACTDITGFGLMGHLHELLLGSGVSAEIYYDSINFFIDSEKFARMGLVPGSTLSNEKYIEEWVNFGNLKQYQKRLLCDSQTSGGLLISIPEKTAYSIMEEMNGAGITASIIGNILPEQAGHIICR